MVPTVIFTSLSGLPLYILTHIKSDNSRIHPVQIFGESQHLAREGAIGSVRYCGDARVR